MGRRKIKMEMVQDMNTRQVTFSKRRTGLFKKASELATLCNAELGIVVFSPGGKPFSYGKPNLDSVAERFMRVYDDSDSDDDEEGGGNNRPKLKKMSEHLDLLNQEIEASMNSMNTKISCRQSMVGSKVKSITYRLRLISCFSPGITRPTCWSYILFLYQPGKLSVLLSSGLTIKLDHLFRQSAVWKFRFKLNRDNKKIR